ncbi:MAG: oligosaccharide flippase family protein [Actinobacteria bacterium]|nr:oligosaccharide flippase family protein [Actinomycetota bacterium]
MSVLGRNISANFAANAWSTVLSLVLTPLYLKFLGVEGYGLIGFYMSWIAIVGILDTGISATAVREIAWLEARPDEKNRIPVLLRSLEVTYWGIVLLVGAGFLVAAWCFGAGWFHASELRPELVRDALMLMAVSLVVQVPSGLYIAGLMGLQRQVEGSGLVALFGTVRGLGAVLVLWKISPDIRAFFAWQIAICGLQTAVMRWSLWRRVRADRYSPRFSLEVLRSIRGFAGGMILVTAVSVVITQADKMILSRMVSLQLLGFYMLAWTVASGLSRVATPLIQAFGPRFTELVSQGNEGALAREVRLASQLMSVLLLPPAALLAFLARPILLAWTGNPTVAAGAAPILAILVVGTALSACSYPALSVLYSRKRLRPVVVVNLASLVVLLPLLVIAVVHFTVMGAAVCWGLYGLTLYVAYETWGLRGLPHARLVSSVLRDFVAPFIVSLGVGGAAGYLLGEVERRLAVVALLGGGLVVGWLGSLMVCKELFAVAKGKLRWTTRSSR